MTTPPTAEVLSVRGNLVTVRCPFPQCGRTHRHAVHRHGWQRFQPGCGMFRSSDERALGYTFTTEPAQPTTHTSADTKTRQPATTTQPTRRPTRRATDQTATQRSHPTKGEPPN